MLVFDIVKYIFLQLSENLTNKLAFSMTTNGSLLDKSSINFISAHDNFSISISLDGTKDTHIKNRIPKNNDITYENIWYNVKRLQKSKRDVRICMTYDKNTIDALSESILFFIKEGFKYIVPQANFMRNNWTEEDFNIIEKELLTVKQYISNNRIKDIYINDIDDNLQSLGKCTGGDSYYNIDTDGLIYPCTYVTGKKKFLIGSLDAGINEEKVSLLLKKYSQPIIECKECCLYDYCDSTRCQYLNYILNNDSCNPNLIECNLLNIKVNLMNQ